MYVLGSMSPGIAEMQTSKRSWTLFKTVESSSEAMNVIARPFVPKRPALPTYPKTVQSKNEDGAYSMEIRISAIRKLVRFGHVVVNHDIHTFDVNTTPKEIGGDQNSRRTIFEFSIDLQTITEPQF